MSLFGMVFGILWSRRCPVPTGHLKQDVQISELETGKMKIITNITMKMPFIT
jgi:hypothetical protein